MQMQIKITYCVENSDKCETTAEVRLAATAYLQLT